MEGTEPEPRRVASRRPRPRFGFCFDVSEAAAGVEREGDDKAGRGATEGEGGE